MFAVPGWSLSPELLKTEQEEPSARKKNKSSKKRKRNAADEVGEKKVSDLYRHQAEVHSPKTKDVKVQETIGNARLSSGLGLQSPTTKSKISKTNHLEKAKRRQISQAAQDEGEEQIPQNDPDQLLGLRNPLGIQRDSTNGPLPAASSLTPMQNAMKQKLISARFRHLNQTLYTCPSKEAQNLFETNSTFFDEYHSGFRQQVQSWPQNPVIGFYEDLVARGSTRVQQTMNGKQSDLRPLPRTSGTCFVVDLGCGDASLAKMLQIDQQRLNIKVQSYDLQASNAFVTKADIANLPLKTDTVDIAILCLALMGTNWIEFVEEAWRVLRWKGELWVAEIKSRFGKAKAQRPVHSVGKRKKEPPGQRNNDAEGTERMLERHVDGVEYDPSQTDLSDFVKVLEKRGFVLDGEGAVDQQNKMFVKMRFVKNGSPRRGRNVETGQHVERKRKHEDHGSDGEQGEGLDESTALKPCLYKTR